MVNGNGQKEDEEKRKYCPLIKEFCIVERCAFYSEFIRDTGGLKQKFSMCSIMAIVMILSELNTKTQPPLQKIQLPNLVKG